MIQIPQQLINQRFILLLDKNKPREKRWQSINNHDLNSNIFQSYLEQNNTVYGVPTGFNNLIVLDFDEKTTQEKLILLLPKTFGIYSASRRLLHLYYFTDDISGIRLDDKTTGKRILDIQGKGQYVVGPNSILPNGKVYDIAHDLPISTLYRSDLLKILKDADINYSIVGKQNEGEKRKIENDMEMFLNQEAIKIKANLNISQLLSRFKIPIHKNPTMCPLGHPSESQACFSFRDDTTQWHCFHCEESGDVITLYQRLYDYKNFQETKQAMQKDLFYKDKKYSEALKILFNLIRERKSPSINQFDIDEIAKIMIDKYNFTTIEENNSMIYYYDEPTGIYKPLGEQKISNDLENIFEGYCKTSIVVEVIKKIQRLTYRPLNMFDTHKNLICLKNGVFNLDTKLLIPFSKDYYFLNNVPITYNEDEQCPKIDKFLGEIVLPEDKELLYEMFGFILMKNYKIQKALVLTGVGANGKTIYLDLLKTFIGNHNTSGETLQSLSDNTFSSSQLFGKLVNISADISDKPIRDSSLFKRLTSGSDIVSAQFKHKNIFVYVNYAKLLFSCNKAPRFYDDSYGLYRRLLVVNFPYKFEGSNDDKNLIEKITTENELSGLFNESLKRYYKLLSVGTFDRTESVDEVKDRYIALSDPLQGFIDKFIDVEPLSHVIKEDLYKKYKDYCAEYKISIPSDKAITSELKRKNLFNEKYQSIICDGESKYKRVLIGLSFRNDEDIIFK